MTLALTARRKGPLPPSTAQGSDMSSLRGINRESVGPYSEPTRLSCPSGLPPVCRSDRHEQGGGSTYSCRHRGRGVLSPTCAHTHGSAHALVLILLHGLIHR